MKKNNSVKSEKLEPIPKSIKKSSSVEKNADNIHKNIETLHENLDRVHQTLKGLEKSIAKKS